MDKKYTRQQIIDMINSIINDGVNLDENDMQHNKTVLSNKIPGIGTNLSHVDYI